MYIPKKFREENLAEIEKLVREFGFATLVSVLDNLPWATHIPLELELDENKNWLLYGHISKANPQWKNFESNPEMLAIFTGPHTYVSPSWYNHKNVPTWNYQAVHVYGKVRIMPLAEVELMLKKLMARYEQTHSKSPHRYEEIPSKILEADLQGLVGFEIIAGRIEAISKLSQGRDNESYHGVMHNLKDTDSYYAKRIAEEMEKRKK
ncbi:MAG: FMN-binding negative transcriptional regulator [Chitinophagales bacterium]